MHHVLFKFEAEIFRLKRRTLLNELETAVRRHHTARLRAHAQRKVFAQKAGFRPDQPRWPAGSGRISGRWSGGAGTGGPSIDENLERPRIWLASHRPPLVPRHRPPTAPERHQILRELARFGPGAFWEAFSAGAAWIAEEAASYFSYFDPPRSLQELQDAVYRPRRGYDIHHIVERHTVATDGSEDRLLNAPENLVRIPRWKHWELNGWYQTPNKDYGQLTPREYLRGTSWELRRQVGLDGLRAIGVLKP